MRYLSVCSGIEAASVAWKPLGWECVGVAEIEKFPSAVLAHHYPNVPNLGDLTKYQEWPRDLAPDLIVGGTPCQSFSVAGLRAGLADPRGNLALVFLGLVDQYRPRYVVWENVPGVRSSGSGRDFGAFLGALGELGYGWAYRSLDAQYFGLAQRRERVFVVGCLGDWRASAAVLLEPEGLRGHPAPRRETRESVARDAGAGAGVGGYTPSGHGGYRRGIGTLRGNGGDLGGGSEGLILAPALANPLTARMHKGVNTTCDEGQTMIAHSLRAEGFDASEDGTGRETPLVPIAFSAKDHGADAGEVSPTLRSMGHAESHPNGGGQVAVAFDTYNLAVSKDGTSQTLSSSATDVNHIGAVLAPALTASNDPSRSPQSSEITQQVAAVHAATMAVRRLTPRECERLQGFPDDYTLIPYRNGRSADGPRYKALGNSMAVPVMAWIGRRIAAVDALLVELQRQEAA